jgi:hypothetical protein
MRALCHASGVASIAEQIAEPLLLEWLASLTADEREIATWPDARLSLSAGRIGMVSVIPFFLVRIVATLSRPLCLGCAASQGTPHRCGAIPCRAAELTRAKSFTIDGEAVVLGPEGLSRFEELSRREAARTAILYAFDLIEYDGEDLRNLPFLERRTSGAKKPLGNFRRA